MKYSDSEIILGSFSYVRLETKAPSQLLYSLPTCLFFMFKKTSIQDQFEATKVNAMHRIFQEVRTE